MVWFVVSIVHRICQHNLDLSFLVSITDLVLGHLHQHGRFSAIGSLIHLEIGLDGKGYVLHFCYFLYGCIKNLHCMFVQFLVKGRFKF